MINSCTWYHVSSLQACYITLGMGSMSVSFCVILLSSPLCKPSFYVHMSYLLARALRLMIPWWTSSRTASLMPRLPWRWWLVFRNQPPQKLQIRRPVRCQKRHRVPTLGLGRNGRMKKTRVTMMQLLMTWSWKVPNTLAWILCKIHSLLIYRFNIRILAYTSIDLYFSNEKTMYLQLFFVPRVDSFYCKIKKPRTKRPKHRSRRSCGACVNWKQGCASRSLLGSTNSGKRGITWPWLWSIKALASTRNRFPSL